MTNTLLTHSELQEIIDVANDNVKTEQTRKSNFMSYKLEGLC